MCKQTGFKIKVQKNTKTQNQIIQQQQQKHAMNEHWVKRKMNASKIRQQL